MTSDTYKLGVNIWTNIDRDKNHFWIDNLGRKRQPRNTYHVLIMFRIIAASLLLQLGPYKLQQTLFC